VRLDGIWIGLERAAEALHRIPGLALFELRVGQVVAGAGEIGFELECLLIAGDRFVDASRGAQRCAQVVVAGRVSGRRVIERSWCAIASS
jgi:hypothetical protein